MLKLVILFKDTDEIGDREEVYQTLKHDYIPKAFKVPGVVKVNLSHMFPTPTSADIGDWGQRAEKPKYFLKFEVYYASKEAFEYQITHPNGVELAKDFLQNFGRFVHLFLAHEEVFHNV